MFGADLVRATSERCAEVSRFIYSIEVISERGKGSTNMGLPLFCDKPL